MSFYIHGQKDILTLEKSITGVWSLMPSSWSNPQWAKNANILYYGKRNKYLYRYNPTKNRTDSIALVDMINPSLKKAGYDTIKSTPGFTFGPKNELVFYSGEHKLSFDMASKKLVKINNAPRKLSLLDSPETPFVFSFSKDDGLYVIKAKGDTVLVAQGSDSIVYGQSVHREEFGISKGTFWSPTGDKLAFYRMDQSMVEQYPIPNWEVIPAKVRHIYYPMAGRKSHHVTLGVYDLNTGKITYLNTKGDPEHYLTNVCWASDGSEIYVAEINRNQNHTEFNAYNPNTGHKIRKLYTETHPKYTEPLTPYTFIPNQSQLFIAESKRDGWNSLYLYKTDGTMIRKLSHRVEVTNIIGFNNKNTVVYYQAILPNTIDLHYFSTDITTGKTTQLSQGPGQHIGNISFDGKYAFESNNTFGEHNQYRVRDLTKNKVQTIFTANEPMENFNIGETRIDSLTAEDGTLLFARTIFPYDFNPAKKYPVVIYVYGGPHAQMISNRRNAQAQTWMYVLANEGFIVFTLDNRGSSNRGMQFENVTHRRMGDIEINDQMIGYKFITSQPYVNPDRVGVHGWSYGGFMTISLMTRQPGKFYAAVAGGPVTDWHMYEVMYTERYMDTPQQNPEGYKNASTFNYIDQLSGPMLLIHGAQDDVVIWQQSMRYIEACIKKGKQVDYFVYPSHPHNVSGKDRIHLIQKVIDYFKPGLCIRKIKNIRCCIYF